MTLSRDYLHRMQETAPKLSDEKRLANLRDMRTEQMRLARSWKKAGSELIAAGHMNAARGFQEQIKALKFEMACARLDEVMGSEPIPQGDYTDIAEHFMSVEESEESDA